MPLLPDEGQRSRTIPWSAPPAEKSRAHQSPQEPAHSPNAFVDVDETRLEVRSTIPGTLSRVPLTVPALPCPRPPRPDDGLCPGGVQEDAPLGSEFRPSDRERQLAGHLAIFQEAKRVPSLGQREGPVEGWRYFAGLQERGKVLKFGSADPAEEHSQPLADEG